LCYNFYRFWHKPLFDAQDEIRALVEPQSVTNTAVALRWLLHHSKLQEGDGIIIGGSSIPHIQENLEAIKNSAPLGEDVLGVIDKCWDDIKGVCPLYFR
jgi:aflatoxin B1 aldehyde reductase